MLEKTNSDNATFGNDGTASSSKSQFQCCLFCYKNCDDVDYNICATKTANDNVITTNSTLNPSQPLMQKFLKLFQRCLMDNQRSGTHTSLLPVPFENHFERLGTCQDCSILLQDFCTLYDQIKCLELKLSWRLKGLHDIMKSAEKVPSRVKAFRNLIVTNEQEETEPGKETLIKIKKFRNSLMGKCFAKLRSTYPKILLKRCNSSDAQCTGNGENKRIKIEMVETETCSTSTSGNEPKSHAVPKQESITVKPLNVVDEDPILDISSVFPVHVKVSPFEDAEESCESRCEVKPLNVEDESSSIDVISSVFPVHVKVPQSEFEDAEEPCENSCEANVEIEETSHELVCNKGDVVRFPSLANIQVDDNALPIPCTSSKIHSERNQNENICKEKKYDQNQIAPTKVANVISKTTEQLEVTCEAVPVNRNERRRSRRLLSQAKAVATQRPKNYVALGEPLSKTCKQVGIDQNDEACPLSSPEEGSDNDDDDYVPYEDDADSDYTPEVDADELEDDDNDILVKGTRINKVEKQGTEAGRIKDPTTSFTNMNAKEKTGLLSLKQLAMNSVLDLPLKLRCKISPCNNTSFISSKDLANHSKWHAKFKCNFCETVFDYVPSLVKHEISEHRRKGEEGSGNCTRCNFNVKGDTFSALTHYLKSHLGLPLVRRTCPICGEIFRRKVSIRQVFLKHFNSEHNITGVALSDVNKCDENNCRTYSRLNVKLSNNIPEMHNVDVGKCKAIISERKDADHRPKDPPTSFANMNAKGKTGLLSLKQLAMNSILDLPLKLRCKISPCSNTSFLSSKDLANHSKWHAKFKCNFCETMFDYAPSLVKHEFNDHKRKGEEGSGKCVRCNFNVKGDFSALIHYLKSHLSLPLGGRVCPICGALFRQHLSLGKDFLKHFNRQHNLSNVALLAVNKCDENSFRTNAPPSRTEIHSSGLDEKYIEKSKNINRRQNDNYEKCICKDCGIELESRLDLEHHQSNHIVPTEFKIACTFPNCEKMFDTEETMEYHKRRMHESENTSCPQSSKSILSTTPEDPDCYLLKGQPSKIHKCDRSECLRKFYNVSDLEIHSRLHGDFKCQFCNKTFTFAPKLPVHEIKCVKRGKVEKLEKSACTRCFCKVSDEKKFISHFVEKHLDLEMDRHTCLICGFHFGASTIKNFQEHLRQRHDLRKVGPDGKIYECKMEGCSAYFLKLKQLRWHKNSHITAGKFRICDEFEVEDGRKYECCECGKRFKCMLMFRQHTERRHLHMRRKAFACTSIVCERRFDTEEERDDHIAVLGLRKCPYCEKLIHGSGFKTHVLRFHQNKGRGNCKKTTSVAVTLQRKWQCEECGKSFKSKDRLSRHRFVHSGPASWEYMCSICSKKCMTEQHLDQHMITHSNEKAFVCEICGVKYKHRHNLRIHVNSKHGDIAYDKPRNFDKTNLTSRKGIKLKNYEGAGTGTRKNKRNGYKQTQKEKYDSSSDSSFSE